MVDKRAIVAAWVGALACFGGCQESSSQKERQAEGLIMEVVLQKRQEWFNKAESRVAYHAMGGGTQRENELEWLIEKVELGPPMQDVPVQTEVAFEARFHLNRERSGLTVVIDSVSGRRAEKVVEELTQALRQESFEVVVQNGEDS